MRHSSLVVLLLTVSALLVMSPAYAARQTAWTATATPLDLTVGPGATAAFLSPDGSRFAYIKINELCLYSLEGEKGNCLKLDKDIRIDLETVRWSPDSTKFAFSEDFFMSLRDSDIWVYDTASNAVTDVTPAPNRGGMVFSKNDKNITYTVDVAPQWSSDSQSITFIRYASNKQTEMLAKFFRVNLPDNVIEEVASAETQVPASIDGFAISPDSSTIVYNLNTRGTEQDGTWFLDIASKKAKFAAAPVEKMIPSAYQFSADGSQVLGVAINGAYTATFQDPLTSPIFLLALNGDQRKAVNADEYVFSAGWGPKGTELAYTTADDLTDVSRNEGLYITNVSGQSGDKALPGLFTSPSPRGYSPLIWASNNTMLLRQIKDNKLVVVRLKQV